MSESGRPGGPADESGNPGGARDSDVGGGGGPMDKPPATGIRGALPGCSLMTIGLTGLMSVVVGMPRVNPATGGRAASRLLRRGIASYQLNVAATRDHSVCVHEPHCSAFAAEAISRHGAIKGSRLAAARIRRCGPSGGHDPVPD